MPKLKGGLFEKWAIVGAYSVRMPTAMDALNR
ncbi:MAG: hypothetical protein QOI05_4035 [Bradyrhizobium sp.]|jgi:hypothetical protein|nr:hypothetical protein [Bradyrhizobium sp.]